MSYSYVWWCFLNYSFYRDKITAFFSPFSGFMLTECINIYSFFCTFIVAFTCLWTQTNLAQRHSETERHWFTSLEARKKTWGEIAGREKVAGGSWEYQGSHGGSNTLRQSAACICWSPAHHPELRHQRQEKSFAGERAIKAQPGSHNCCQTASSGKPWRQGNATRGKIHISFGRTATPCLCCPICRILLFTSSFWASVNAHKGKWAWNNGDPGTSQV